MRISRTFVLVAAVMLAGAVMLGRSLAQEQPTTAPTGADRVGVCDIVQIFNQYARAADLNTALNEKGQALQAEDTKRGEAIDALTKELELLKEGSPEYEQRFNEAQRLTIERQAWVKFQESLVMRERHRLTLEMYEEVRKAVGEVAQQRGIDVVLYNVREPLKGETTQQLLQEMQDRKVLYSSDSADMTEVVLAKLNEAYRASKK